MRIHRERFVAPGYDHGNSNGLDLSIRAHPLSVRVFRKPFVSDELYPSMRAAERRQRVMVRLSSKWIRYALHRDAIQRYKRS